MKMPGTSGGTGVALTSFFSVTPNLIVEHFQGCSLSLHENAVALQGERYNHLCPDFDVTVGGGPERACFCKILTWFSCLRHSEATTKPKFRCFRQTETTAKPKFLLNCYFEKSCVKTLFIYK
jgi:hypothetical protein